jgi:hypothetical protein
MEVAKREPEATDHTNRLPAELKCAIARYIDTPANRKALVLVNKAWSEVVLPFLWETLTTDLTQIGQRRLLGISHPGSNILKHIRNISLLHRNVSTSEDILSTLLVAIPRGQLRGFTSTDRIPIQTLNLLLLSHPNLERLELPTNCGLSGVLQSPWTIGCLSNLENIVVHVQGFASDGLRRLWDECPKLTHLYLMGGSPAISMPEEAFVQNNGKTVMPSTGQDNANTRIRSAPRIRLERLRIGQIILPKQLDTMFHRIDVLTHRELTLDATMEPSKLLDAMSAEFTKGHPCLTLLHIKGHPEHSAEGFITSINLLLSSFLGLKSFRLWCVNSNKLHVEGIVNHGKTLESLYVVNGGIHREVPGACFDASDLVKIATACSELDQLCLNLYEIDTERDESDVLGPFPGESFTPNEFEQALVATASIPKLKILRFTNPPNFRKAFHTTVEYLRYFRRNLQSGIERQGLQARADSLMQYLGEHGSSIQVLAFSPAEQLRKVDHTDKHGHVWPHYYCYGVRLKDEEGKSFVVARPLIDWKNEFPDARVLEDVEDWTRR